jgi:sugar O-acyltransferase (sialic acid O-acetyltransferase NeuD family)
MEDIQFNKKKTIIVGASGFGREIVSWINFSDKNKKKYDIVGFLDDDLSKSEYLPNFIGKIELEKISKNHQLLIGISDCHFKEKIFESAKINQIQIETYIHDTSLIGARTILGIGAIIFPYTVISCDVNIGNLVFINNGSQIGHDTSIGDYSSIMANVDIGGGAFIGKNVFIGSNAVILPGVKVPDNCIIGAGSVVIRSIKKTGSYFGNPAKKIF